LTARQAVMGMLQRNTFFITGKKPGYIIKEQVYNLVWLNTNSIYFQKNL